MKGNCGECERRWCCDIAPEECDQWPEPVPMTNADRIRSMTDEELAAVLDGYGAYSVCDLVCGGVCRAFASLKETSDEKCRRIILEKLRAPYKEKEHGQTIGADTEA